jgi:D-alanyl-D-alanine dipeptidase
MKQTTHKLRFFQAAILTGFFVAGFSTRIFAQGTRPPLLAKKPPDMSPSLKPLLGEYGPENARFIVLEKFGNLVLRTPNGSDDILQPEADGDFIFSDLPHVPVRLHFSRADSGFASSISFGVTTLPRRQLGPEEGQTFRIKPVRSVDALRKEALVVSPPRENGKFRDPDLVELVSLDPRIHLDIRYATTNNFLGTPLYTQARAFLQRPAADALLLALHRLKPFGYGLLIHDAYRPWYVTKIFWDATPPEGKIFVADPAEGSRHNRGCAVDLTLYDLKTSKPIEMPGTYDEMSPRSFPDYPGGTSLQRWHRDLLRWAMESEGFTVYEHEWWHFDYKDWREYPILNVPFEKLQFTEKQVR